MWRSISPVARRRVGETPKRTTASHSLAATGCFFFVCGVGSLREDNPPTPALAPVLLLMKWDDSQVQEQPCVEEWGEERLSPSFQHLDSSRLRYAQAQDLKSGGRELVLQ